MPQPLKKTSPSVTPTRLRLNTGATPTRKVRLMGSNGQVLTPKSGTSAVPASVPETPQPAPPEAAVEEVVQEAPAAEVPQNQAEEVVQEAPSEEVPQGQAEEAAQEAASEEVPQNQAEEVVREAPSEEVPQGQAEEAAPEAAAEEVPQNQAEEVVQEAASEEVPQSQAEEAAQEAPVKKVLQTPARKVLQMPTTAGKASPLKPAGKVTPQSTAGKTVPVSTTAGKTSPLKPVGKVTPQSTAGKTVPVPTAAGKASPLKPAGKTAPTVPAGEVTPQSTAGGTKPATPLPAAAPQEVSSSSPLQDVDAQYIEQLRQQAAKPPVWKSKLFISACAGLVVVCVICGVLIVQHNAKLDAKREENARIMKVLLRARAINQQNVETLADAKEKNVNVKCSKAEARFLMRIVVNPEMKDDEGKPLFGGHPDGVAQLACMLLSIACEDDADICKYVFDRLNKDAAKIKATTYRWFVQRLAVANIKGINAKLHKLAGQIADKSPKKLRKRDDLLSYIWESMGLRVTPKDIQPITEIIRNPDTANGLVHTLSVCLSNIVEMEDSPDKRKELGDKIFDAVPENRRGYLTEALAKSCSPKALEYFKQRTADPKNWLADQNFFSNYAQDDIVSYLQQELMPMADNDHNKKLVENMIAGVLRQNRDRSPEDARKLIKLVYDKIDEDTSEWSSIIEQTDPDAGTFIGENNPKYNALMEKKKVLEVARAQKINLVRVLSSMYDWAWVVQILENYEKDSDTELVAKARDALGKVKKNRSENDKVRAGYKKRTKE